MKRQLGPFFVGIECRALHNLNRVLGGGYATAVESFLREPHGNSSGFGTTQALGDLGGLL